MSYFLRTLEGLGMLGDTSEHLKRFEKQVDIFKRVYSLKDSFFYALKSMREYWPDESLDDIYNYYAQFKDAPNYPAISEGIRLFKAYESRQRQKEQAQAQASEQAQAQARAIYQAEAEAEAAELEARRAAAYRREQDEAAAQAAEEIERYTALRDEIKLNLEYIENGQRILTTPEQMQIYKELTGREYSEILNKDDELKQIINEVAPMQEINIENQVIESLPTYTIISEDSESITYEDEAGNVHIEPKASAAPWLVIAAAAVLFLA